MAGRARVYARRRRVLKNCSPGEGERPTVGGIMRRNALESAQQPAKDFSLKDSSACIVSAQAAGGRVCVGNPAGAALTNFAA